MAQRNLDQLSEAVLAIGSLFAPESPEAAAARQQARKLKAEADMKEAYASGMMNPESDRETLDRLIQMETGDYRNTGEAYHASLGVDRRGQDIKAQTDLQTQRMASDATVEVGRLGAQADVFDTIADPEGRNAVPAQAMAGIMPTPFNVGAAGPQDRWSEDEVRAHALRTTMTPEEIVRSGYSAADMMVVSDENGPATITHAGDAMGLQEAKDGSKGQPKVENIKVTDANGKSRVTSGYTVYDAQGRPVMMDATTNEPVEGDYVTINNISADGGEVTPSTQSKVDSSVVTGLNTLGLLNDTIKLIEANPTSAGLVGTVDRFVGTARSITQEAGIVIGGDAQRRIEELQAAADSGRFGNNPVARQIYTMRLMLAPMIAKTMDPSSEISAKEIDAAMNMMGGENLSSAKDQIESLRSIYRTMLKQTERNTMIGGYAPDTQIMKMFEAELAESDSVLGLAGASPEGQNASAPSTPARQSVTTPSGISLEVEF